MPDDVMRRFARMNETRHGRWVRGTLWLALGALAFLAAVLGSVGRD